MNVIEKTKQLLKENRPLAAAVEIATYIDRLCWENKFDEVYQFIDTMNLEEFSPEILRFCCIQLSHTDCDKDTYVKFYNRVYDTFKNVFELSDDRIISFEKRLKWENLK